MKTILIVITTAYIPTGGLATVVMNYYRQIDKTNIHIDIASTNEAPEALLHELHNNGSSYYCLGSRKIVFQYFCRLWNLCNGYDIIHVNGNSATTVIEHFAAKLAGVKKRINHNHTSIPDHKITSNILYPLFKSLVTDKVACSDLAGNWLYGKGNFMILRNAINVEKYQYDACTRKRIRTAFRIEDKDVVVGHVGKIYKPKNHPYLIRIFAEYHKLNPHSKLLLVGDGVMRKEVETLVDEMDVRAFVIFAGLRTDIPEMLQAIDYFVFPSIWEGMPLSVLEALSSGLTCVISDHISKDVMIGPNIYALPIESDPKEWAEFIFNHPVPNRLDTCKKNSQLITKAGYNIKEKAKELLKLYLD